MLAVGVSLFFRAEVASAGFAAGLSFEAGLVADFEAGRAVA